MIAGAAAANATAVLLDEPVAAATLLAAVIAGAAASLAALVTPLIVHRLDRAREERRNRDVILGRLHGFRELIPSLWMLRLSAVVYAGGARGRSAFWTSQSQRDEATSQHDGWMKRANDLAVEQSRVHQQFHETLGLVHFHFEPTPEVVSCLAALREARSFRVQDILPKPDTIETSDGVEAWMRDALAAAHEVIEEELTRPLESLVEELTRQRG